MTSPNPSTLSEPLLQALRTEAQSRNSIQNTAHPESLDDFLWPTPGLSNYGCEEFLCLPDTTTFIRAAYRCILQRPVDAISLIDCQEALKQGQLRIQMLHRLYHSEEAQKTGVQLTGLEKVHRLYQLEQRFPRLMRKLRKLTHYWLTQEQKHWVIAGQAILNQQLIRVISSLLKLPPNQQQQTYQLHQLEEHVAFLRNDMHYQQRSVNRLLDTLRATTEPAQIRAAVQQSDDYFQAFYVAFENKFRGTPAQIDTKLRQYLDHLPATNLGSGHVLDLGCGRGEWLKLLQNAGYKAEGLDANRVMVDLCTEQGLMVTDTPLHQWLATAPSNSLSGLTGFHIAEHLPFNYLLELLQESVRVLQPGGVIILETPNPENTTVGSHSFYHDPTHKNPLTPSLMQFVAEHLGLINIRILRLNPLEQAHHLPEDSAANHFINTKFCSAQDYALIAYKPGSDTARENCQ